MGMRGKNEYTLTLRDMRGVDFSATTSERKRFRYLENMYKDYSGRGGSVIESAPGFRVLTNLAGEIHGIYTQRDSSSEEYVIVHAGQ